MTRRRGPGVIRNAGSTLVGEQQKRAQRATHRLPHPAPGGAGWGGGRSGFLLDPYDVARFARRWQVDEELARRALEWWLQLDRDFRIRLAVTSGRRSYARQLQLWRTLPPGQADPPWESPHVVNPAEALDFSHPDKALVRRADATTREHGLPDRHGLVVIMHQGTGLHLHVESSDGR